MSEPTLGLIGALLLALIVAIAWVTVSNGVAERRDNLARVETEADAAEDRAAALKPYGEVEALVAQTQTTIRTLDAARFDWSRLLAELSRRVPADVTLTTLTGTMAPTDPAAIAAGEGSTVALAGCTTDHTAVARLMDRLRGVESVTDVALGTSSIDGKPSSKDGTCPRRDQFDVTVAIVTPADVVAVAGEVTSG